jgi:hypothetical protein
VGHLEQVVLEGSGADEWPVPGFDEPDAAGEIGRAGSASWSSPMPRTTSAIGLFAFGAARYHGGSFGRATAYALVVVAVATTVAIGKYLLTGH